MTRNESAVFKEESTLRAWRRRDNAAKIGSALVAIER
jgi:hypothetical protein